eukprot:TRINITY_DN32959_c0_g1_i1.p1 TRINITY_DN32959_c0_g1~~TRINITY_DN32959_c0_g1_i1.p1  ORF type:complete len:282 (+),score=-12.26 TRINITY_DN32959_c0_g1_i1:33-848(+)
MATALLVLFFFPLFLFGGAYSASLAAAPMVSVAAPAPAPDAPPKWVNLTDVLVKAGQFSHFLGLISRAGPGASDALQSRANDTHAESGGVTLLAPTDAAFEGLRPEYKSALAKLSSDNLTKLVECHAVPKFVAMDGFGASDAAATHTMSNCALHVSAFGAQVNVSTPLASTALEGSVYSRFPVAVYTVDHLLLPQEMFGDIKLSPLPAPSPAPTPLSESPSSGVAAGKAPSADGKDGDGKGVKSFAGPPVRSFSGMGFGLCVLGILGFVAL